jgi:hypothetical protein
LEEEYDGLLQTEMRRLKQLEEENARSWCRSVARQGDAAGRDPPKSMKPGSRNRKLVDAYRMADFDPPGPEEP